MDNDSDILARLHDLIQVTDPPGAHRPRQGTIDPDGFTALDQEVAHQVSEPGLNRRRFHRESDFCLLFFSLFSFFLDSDFFLSLDLAGLLLLSNFSSWSDPRDLLPLSNLSPWSDLTDLLSFFPFEPEGLDLQ